MTCAPKDKSSTERRLPRDYGDDSAIVGCCTINPNEFTRHGAQLMFVFLGNWANPDRQPDKLLSR